MSKLIIPLIILIILLIILIFQPINIKFQEQEYKLVRKSAVAGKWYPNSTSELDSYVDELLEKATPQGVLGKPRALISPHAGYLYSGQVAAFGYKSLIPYNYTKVIVIGPSHFKNLIGISIANKTHYSTPLGEIKISKDALNLIKSGIAGSNPEIHEKEYSIEAQLPFLQKTIDNFELVPIVVGDIDATLLSNILNKIMDENTLLVVSVDLSHYHTFEQALILDNKAINAIHHYDFQALQSSELDAKNAVAVLMALARQNKLDNSLLMYGNSGDVTEDRSSVVGYSSFAFYEHNKADEDEQEYLINLARKTVENYLNDKSLPDIDESQITPYLKKEIGCFVTINKNDELRGCIGNILPKEPLFRCVIKNAVNAAVNDERFEPIEELKDLEFEVNILSPPKELQFNDPTDLLNKLIPFVDGVAIQLGEKGATYLPTVWELIPNKIDFMNNLCNKAQLDLDCWKNKDLQVFTYKSQIIIE